jgi:hypothetical protein
MSWCSWPAIPKANNAPDDVVNKRDRASSSKSRVLESLDYLAREVRCRVWPWRALSSHRTLGVVPLRSKLPVEGLFEA